MKTGCVPYTDIKKFDEEYKSSKLYQLAQTYNFLVACDNIASSKQHYEYYITKHKYGKIPSLLADQIVSDIVVDDPIFKKLGYEYHLVVVPNESNKVPKYKSRHLTYKEYDTDSDEENQTIKINIPYESMKFYKVTLPDGYKFDMCQCENTDTCRCEDTDMCQCEETDSYLDKFGLIDDKNSVIYGGNYIFCWYDQSKNVKKIDFFPF